MQGSLEGEKTLNKVSICCYKNFAYLQLLQLLFVQSAVPFADREDTEGFLELFLLANDTLLVLMSSPWDPGCSFLDTLSLDERFDVLLSKVSPSNTTGNPLESLSLPNISFVQ